MFERAVQSCVGALHLRLPRRGHRLAGRRAAHRRLRAARHRRHRRAARRPGRRLPGADRGGDGEERGRPVAAAVDAAGGDGAVPQAGRARRSRTSPTAGSTPAGSGARTRWARGARRAATTTCVWTSRPGRWGRRCGRRGSSWSAGGSPDVLAPGERDRRVDRRRGRGRAPSTPGSRTTRARSRWRARSRTASRRARRATSPGPRSASARRCGSRRSRATTTPRGCWRASSRCST